MGSSNKPVIYFGFSLLLRSLLIAASVIGVVFMLSSKQSEDWYTDSSQTYYETLSFKFTQSPAFIYYVAALSLSGLYGLITMFTSFLVILAPASSAVLVLFAIFDVVSSLALSLSLSLSLSLCLYANNRLNLNYTSKSLIKFTNDPYSRSGEYFCIVRTNIYIKIKLILGIIASATGTTGSVAYILLRGNEDFRWSDSCYAYNKFCRHLGVSFGVSLVASILLVLLLWTSVITLSKRISSKRISPPPQFQLHEALWELTGFGFRRNSEVK
ncbi:hypothetical protein DVH24_041429 [Malus domestica]|uniref:CASP-like protein n=1 Tax=Malus domestica TaxID=3750 RepID=A0A498IDS7_MALDO|nr:hypothetical protein DVH24_041429 [Malus domestica]